MIVFYPHTVTCKKILGTNESYFTQLPSSHYSSINLFYSEIGIIQFGAPKLQICPKHPKLFYFQHNHNVPKTGLPLDKFLGLMGSKFEYIYFKKNVFS